MNALSLQRWIAHPEVLNKDTLYELRTLLARYPYSQSLRLLYLKNLYLLHDITFGSELRKSAFYITDRRVLFYLIEGDKYKLPKHQPRVTLVQAEPVTQEVPVAQEELVEEPSLDRTLSLIDAFLSTTPDGGLHSAELDYAIDYTTYLMSSGSGSEALHPGLDADFDIEQASSAGQPGCGASPQLGRGASPLKGQELIDGFIAKAESGSSMKLMPLDEDEEVKIEGPSFSYFEEEEEDTCFTETLAKIYIKQRRYSKALEIIKKLNLKYPKKNVYFADQIRFLEKLIINTNNKN